MVFPYWTVSHFSVFILARRGHDCVRTSPTPPCTTLSSLSEFTDGTARAL
jgi:hypothetical protein